MTKAKLTFLGTGTSQGIPVIGCNCDVCTSTDPRDNRLRSSVFVEYGNLNILVDCGPDFREQMLRAGICHVDAILLTHNHKDHTGGLDDIRSLNLAEKKPVNIYCEQYVIDAMEREYTYAFTQPRYPGSPEWQVHAITDTPFKVHSNTVEDDLVWVSGKGYCREKSKTSVADEIEIVPIKGWHHKEKKLSVMGYRFGNIAYLTDMNNIDECEFEKLKGLDAVTINCVKRTPHMSHFSLDEALEFFRKVGARESYITHISHLLPKHSDFAKELPQGVFPAYDGLVLEY